jgi:amidase
MEGGRARIAVCTSTQWAHASSDMVQAVERTAAALERAGMQLERLVLPPELEALAEAQPRIVAFEARRALGHERLHAPDALSPRLAARLAGGAEVSWE